MIEGVRIRTAQQYFNDFGYERIYKREEDRYAVRRELIDEFHKEIFGLVEMRAKKQFKDIPKKGDPEALRIARNVIKDATKKWLKLVSMFESYKETAELLSPNDIKIDPNDTPNELGFENGELITTVDEPEEDIQEGEEANE